MGRTPVRVASRSGVGRDHPAHPSQLRLDPLADALAPAGHPRPDGVVRDAEEFGSLAAVEAAKDGEHDRLAVTLVLECHQTLEHVVCLHAMNERRRDVADHPRPAEELLVSQQRLLWTAGSHRIEPDPHGDPGGPRVRALDPNAAPPSLDDLLECRAADRIRVADLPLEPPRDAVHRVDDPAPLEIAPVGLHRSTSLVDCSTKVGGSASSVLRSFFADAAEELRIDVVEAAAPELEPVPGPQFRVFGEPGLFDARLRSGHEEALFAYLVRHAGHDVPSDRLAEMLWDSETKTQVRGQLAQLMTRIRDKCDPDRRRHFPPADKRRGTYRFELHGEHSDLDLFQKHVEDGTHLEGNGEHHGAAIAYGLALGLFAGKDDLAYLSSFPRVYAEYGGVIRERSLILARSLAIRIELEGDYEGSIDQAMRFLAAEPANERAGILAATALIGARRPRDEALKVLQDCNLDVRRATGAPPSEAFRDFQTRVQGTWEPKSPTRGKNVPGPPTATTAYPFPENPGTLDARLRSPELDLPRSARVRGALEALASWALSDDILRLFDTWPRAMRRPAPGTYRDVFADMVRQTEHWNFRRHLTERWAQVIAERSDEYATLTLTSAAALGMREPTIPFGVRYDAGVSLGGARLAPYCRTRWLDEIVARKESEIGTVCYATSFRPIDDPAELAHTGSYAPGAEWEFDLMHAAACSVDCFGPCHVEDIEDVVDEKPEGDLAEQRVWAAWKRIRRYAVGDAVPAWGLAAPSAAPLEHRPRTPDTLRFCYEHLTREKLLRNSASIVLVTSAIYVPYQQIEALRVLALPYDLTVETIAFPREWNAPAAASQSTQNLHDVGNYLQEIRSALQACKRLADDFPEGELARRLRRCCRVRRRCSATVSTRARATRAPASTICSTSGAPAMRCARSLRPKAATGRRTRRCSSGSSCVHSFSERWDFRRGGERLDIGDDGSGSTPRRSRLRRRARPRFGDHTERRAV